MNPFAMERKEFNLEKKDFLKTLIALLWKGVDGQLSQVEDTVISSVLSSYYYEFFWLDEGPKNHDRPQELKFDTFYLYSIGKIREIRSEEHTSELQSLMRISYAVFCLKKKNKKNKHVREIY